MNLNSYCSSTAGEFYYIKKVSEVIATEDHKHKFAKLVVSNCSQNISENPMQQQARECCLIVTK